MYIAQSKPRLVRLAEAIVEFFSYRHLLQELENDLVPAEESREERAKPNNKIHDIKSKIDKISKKKENS
jgi:hypothetical protein